MVYVFHMTRTNIDIDDDLLQTVMQRYDLRTKTEAVDYSLRRLAGIPMTREETRAMFGTLPDFQVPADEGP